MVNQSNSKVVGAFVVGLSLVTGAYVLNNFGQNYSPTTTPQSITTVEAPLRMPIPVSDTNNDGIEDWQEEFVSTNIVNVQNGSDSYLAPETLTGKIGVSFIEEIILAKGYEEFGPSTEEVIDSTVNTIIKSTEDKIYDIKEITIIKTTDSGSVRAYANAHASALIDNNVPDLRDPLVILKEVVDGKTDPGLKELETLSEVYRKIRDSVLRIPVPSTLAKEHLDLINIYNALHEDLKGMGKSGEDPLVALVRLRRYEDDTLALGLALQNLGRTLKKYNFEYTESDPSVVFLAFILNSQ